MSLKLLTIPFSHYCEKARWALDLSDLDYTEEGHLPIVHYAYNLKNGARATVPALICPEGVLCDSGDILNYVQQSGTVLYPEKQEREIRAWEERCDRIGILGRAWAYSHLIGQIDFMRELIQDCDAQEQKLAQPFLGVLGILLSKKYNVRPGKGEVFLKELNAHFEYLDWFLQDDKKFLIDNQFTAADLSLCALAGILVHPEEYGYAYPPLAQYPEAMREQIKIWQASTTGQYILNIYHQYRGQKH